MSKRVYKFISAQYGISSIEKKRLKLSTIKELNDPFELCALDTTNPAISNAVDALSSLLWNKTAILCFSRNWDNLLMWSHYGDSHKGICLGFDIPERDSVTNYYTDVLYQSNLLQILRSEDLNFDLADRLTRTKHESWSYEQEVRMFSSLTDPPEVIDGKDIYWIDFSPNLVLKEVIIGAQCHPTVSKQVEEAVKPYGDAVVCRWAGMRSDAFLLVRQDHPPHWHSRVR